MRFAMSAEEQVRAGAVSRVLRWSGRWLRRAMIAGVVAGAVGVLALAIGYYTYTARPPTQAELWETNKVPSITVKDWQGEVITTRGAFYGERLNLDQLPDHLVQAFLATEDRRFRQHPGIDPEGLARAMWENVKARRFVQGGSTITQQLAKNLFLSSSRTLSRKAEEMALALWLERHLSKDEILTIYLNRIYLGAGTYGIDAAAQRYFGKSASEVSLAEAAMLAGLPKAPSRYAPTRDLRLAQARADLVLQNMVAAGYLTQGEAFNARANPAAPIERPNTDGLQYFVDFVINEAVERLGELTTNIVIETTLDQGLQKKAETAVAAVLSNNAEPLKAGQAALVSMANDGAVRAMVGGRSYSDSQFNRAVQAMRQPGSAFKPFVYLAALEAGITPDAVVRDAPIRIDAWEPRNYSGTYEGRVTVRQAFAKSLNTVAVQLQEEVGRKAVIEAAFRLGLRSQMTDHPSLALGTNEVSVFDLTSAFVPFARTGLSADRHAVTRITSEDGEELYRREPAETVRLIERDTAEAMTNLMHQVMIAGTGRRAVLKDRDSAGKSGTSQDWRDAWFVGYTADLTTGVWVGNDDFSPMGKVTGGGLPAMIWNQYMSAAHEGWKTAALPGAYKVVDRPQTDELRRFFADLSQVMAEENAAAQREIRSARRDRRDRRDRHARDDDRPDWWPW